MPYGSHWEWRGFGGVTGRFVQIYSSLESHYKLHSVQDRYIRIPGLCVNAKFREGAENGLKFKRPEKRDGDFEVWTENEHELFNFPLSDEAWNTLLKMLKSAGLTLPDAPPSSFSQNEVAQWLQQAGCEIVEVHKERESRLWQGDNGSVLVEWACISEPQSIISIGLENFAEGEAYNLTSNTGKLVVESAVKELGLDREPLHYMNYMDAVKLWVQGNKI